jgi:hypothetical protein
VGGGGGDETDVRWDEWNVLENLPLDCWTDLQFQAKYCRGGGGLKR